MFPHEKLAVYHKALTFTSLAATYTAQWNKRHAVVDQFDRAGESLVLNLAHGARLPAGQAKLVALDYSLGSCLECAGCLDVAEIKALLPSKSAREQKEQLSEIARMLIGLRKAWRDWAMQEDQSGYSVGTRQNVTSVFFHHESLEVYAAALHLIAWFVQLPEASHLSRRVFKQIDEYATRIVLTIAEGNGRYSEMDHRRFLDMAETAAVKLAAYLDLAAASHRLRAESCAMPKEILLRIVAMLSRM